MTDAAPAAFDRRGSAFVDRLDASDRAALLDRARRRCVPAHGFIFFAGDASHNVFVLESGFVKIASVIDDREVTLDVLGPGEVVGELGAVDGSPRSATASTLTDVWVHVLAAPEFMSLVESNPSVARHLVQDMARRLRDASQRQVEYGALDGVGRVCGRLVELMRRYGRECGAGIVLDAPLNQSDIASWAGLSREAVVKALRSLRETGWVTTTGRSITVVDPGAVRRRAGCSDVHHR